MKRMAVFLDGTWQRLAQSDPSNIAKLAQSVAHEDAKGVSQIVHYNRGVGAQSETNAPVHQQVFAAITGEGLEDSLTDAYLFLSWNYTIGDEIYIFGFSRGAYAARSLGGLIRNAGLLHRPHADMVEKAIELYRSKAGPDTEAAVQFRKEFSYDPAAIAYVGVFDTVGQRGVPSYLGPIAWLSNEKLRFHDLRLSSLVKSARHACAIDEERTAFPVTPWDNLDVRNHALGFDPSDPKAPYQQRWFPGSHGEVGGGVGSRLANIPMRWIADGAAAAGLSFTTENSPLVRCSAPEAQDPLGDLLVERGLLDWLGKAPRRLKVYKRPAKPAPADVAEMMSEAALRRWRAEHLTPSYRPLALKPYAPLLDAHDVGSKGQG